MKLVSFRELRAVIFHRNYLIQTFLGLASQISACHLCPGCAEGMQGTGDTSRDKATNLSTPL